jgi:hypothetical protein
MSKEKDLLKEILANTKAIMLNLKINDTLPPAKKTVKKSAQKVAVNRQPAKKTKK